MPVFNREFPNSTALRWMLYDYNTGTFEKRQNIEVAQRYKGSVSLSITIGNTYFGMEISPDQADDLAAGLTELAAVVRARDLSVSDDVAPGSAS